MTLEAPTIKFGNGAEKVQGAKTYPSQRSFEVLYLDEELKIIRYLPEDKDTDPVLFVQRRVPADAPASSPFVEEEGETEQAEAQDEEEEQAAEPVSA